MCIVCNVKDTVSLQRANLLDKLIFHKKRMNSRVDRPTDRQTDLQIDGRTD